MRQNVGQNMGLVDKLSINFRHFKWQMKVIKQRKRFPPGSFINCCGTKLAVVLYFDNYDGVDYWDIENQKFGACSLMHCAPQSISVLEAEKLVKELVGKGNS